MRSHASALHDPSMARSSPDRTIVWTRRLAAEVFGTFALTVVAVGADVAGRLSGGEVGPAARAVAPALIVSAMIYALGDVSGAHYNPVVSLAFVLRRLFPVGWLVPYWLAQLAGAIGASLLLRALFGDAVTAGVSEPHLVSPGTAVVLETLLTLLLVTVILGTADRHALIGPDAALAVGATIAMCGLIAIPLDGASMNPARSIGPAAVSGELRDLWVYLTGPAVGSVLAVGMAMLLHGPTSADGEAREAARGNEDASKDGDGPANRPAEMGDR
jgi:aquaporin Z